MFDPKNESKQPQDDGEKVCLVFVMKLTLFVKNFETTSGVEQRGHVGLNFQPMNEVQIGPKKVRKESTLLWRKRAQV